MSWPAPRPRQSVSDPDPERSVRKRWPWYAAAMLLGLALGALGYLWRHPASGPARIAVATAATPAVQQPPQTVAPAAGAEGIVEGTPVPSAPDTSGIRVLLDRWAGALKRGDADAAAQCYAPVVSTYFDRHAVTRQAVGQSIRKPHAHYGHLDVFRISDLGITPVSEDRAVATFRKHWRMSGHGKSGGEEQERMTLVRTDGVWHISSEQAEIAGAEPRSPSL
jgi:ketosteroid isomerase-like protein